MTVLIAFAPLGNSGCDSVSTAPPEVIVRPAEPIEVPNSEAEEAATEDASGT